MNELDESLKSQTEYGSGLWRMARRECRARVLARSVAQLRRAHRVLAQRDATLPRTASAGRHQRQSVELLQSHARTVEAQVVKVNAIAAELETAVGKRLATLEALCLAAPVGSRREGARSGPPGGARRRETDHSERRARGGKALAAEVFQTEAEAELLSVDTLSEGSEKPWGLVLRWKPKSGGLDQGTDQTNQRLCARLASQPPVFFQSVIIAAVLESGVGIPPFAVSTRAVQYCVWGAPVEAQEIRHILRGLSSW